MWPVTLWDHLYVKAWSMPDPPWKPGKAYMSARIQVLSDNFYVQDMTLQPFLRPIPSSSPSVDTHKLYQVIMEPSYRRQLEWLNTLLQKIQMCSYLSCHLTHQKPLTLHRCLLSCPPHCSLLALSPLLLLSPWLLGVIEVTIAWLDLWTLRLTWRKTCILWRWPWDPETRGLTASRILCQGSRDSLCLHSTHYPLPACSGETPCSRTQTWQHRTAQEHGPYRGRERGDWLKRRAWPTGTGTRAIPTQWMVEIRLSRRPISTTSWKFVFSDEIYQHEKEDLSRNVSFVNNLTPKQLRQWNWFTKFTWIKILILIQ